MMSSLVAVSHSSAPKMDLYQPAREAIGVQQAFASWDAYKRSPPITPTNNQFIVLFSECWYHPGINAAKDHRSNGGHSFLWHRVGASEPDYHLHFCTCIGEAFRERVYFDSMAAPVACFVGGHRKICKQDLRKLDIKFRKLVRTIVGFPGGLNWSPPFHAWNARVLGCTEQAGVNFWPRRCLEQHWKLANYIANLPDNRWLKRALAWTTTRRTTLGRPTSTSDSQIHMHCRWKCLG